MPDLVTVKIFSSKTEAELVQGILVSHGIKSIIMADNAGGMEPYPMSYSYGAELKVSRVDLEKARNILSNPKGKK